MRGFRDRDLETRAERWWAELTQGSASIAAEDLYIGPYWATVRALKETAATRRFAINLWVASAGYGLLHSTSPVRPYSATFAPNVADSVIRPGDRSRGFDAKGWWRALSAFKVPGASAPRRLAVIAKRDPKARFLVIGSPAYVGALEEDLLALASLLKDPHQLVIVTGAPGPRAEPLRELWVESSARLLRKVEGSLPALHARVARQILDEAPEFGFNAAELRARWAAISKRSPKAMKPQRTVTTDDEVKEFIRTTLRQNPSGKQTRLLHDFRASGRACEQKRFKGLFEDVVKERAR